MRKHTFLIVALFCVSVFAQTVVTLGYGSKISWGESIETVKQKYPNGELEKILENMFVYIQDGVYRTNIRSRNFHFYNNKLYAITENYGGLDILEYNSMVKKLISLYGDYQVDGDGRCCTWKYSKNLTIETISGIEEEDDDESSFLYIDKGINIVYSNPVTKKQADLEIEKFLEESKRWNKGSKNKELAEKEQAKKKERVVREVEENVDDMAALFDAPPAPAQVSAPSDFKYHWYLNNVRNKIESNFRPPSEDRRLEVVVRFTINSDGSAKNISVAKSSGNSTLDGLAVRAVTVASPFGKLPPGFSGDKLNMSCTLRPTRR